MRKTKIITLFLLFILLSSTITVASAFSVNELKIEVQDKRMEMPSHQPNIHYPGGKPFFYG
jgi:CHASE3 domain sensor protein